MGLTSCLALHIGVRWNKVKIFFNEKTALYYLINQQLNLVGINFSQT